MRLRRFLLLRSLQLIPVALTVVVLNFLLIHLAPGDVSILLAGENADPAYLELVREKYGLDRPFHEQLWVYLRQVATGDLGLSFRSRQPVLDEILERVPATLLLVGTSLALSVVTGTLIGAWIARRPGSWVDSAVSALSVALFSVPVFWFGLMLILLLSVQVPVFPTMGMVTPGAGYTGLARAADVAWHLVLPVLSLMTVSVGQYVRIARTSMAEAMTEPYVATARAIGYSERDVALRQALPNAALPIVTVLGLQIGLLLTGAVLTETVFSWPGLGRMLYDAILARDTPVILGTFIAMSATVALSSLATDLAYAALDPRVRL